MEEEIFHHPNDHKELVMLFLNNFNFSCDDKSKKVDNVDVLYSLIRQLNITEKNASSQTKNKTKICQKIYSEYFENHTLLFDTLDCVNNIFPCLREISKIRQSIDYYQQILNNDEKCDKHPQVVDCVHSLTITKNPKIAETFTKTSHHISNVDLRNFDISEFKNSFINRDFVAFDIKNLTNKEQLRIGLLLVDALYQDYIGEQVDGLMLIARAFDDSLNLRRFFPQNAVLVRHFKYLFRLGLFNQFEFYQDMDPKKVINRILSISLKLEQVRDDIILKIDNFNIFFYDYFYIEISQKYFDFFTGFCDKILFSVQMDLQKFNDIKSLRTFQDKTFSKLVQLLRKTIYQCVVICKKLVFDEYIKIIFDGTLSCLKKYLSSYFCSVEKMTVRMNTSQILRLLDDINCIAIHVHMLINTFDDNVLPHKLDSQYFAQLKSNLDQFVLFVESKFTPLINNALNSAIRLIGNWMREYNHLYIDRESAIIESFKLNLKKVLHLLCKINSLISNYSHSNRKTISSWWALKFIEFLNLYYTSEVKCDHCGTSYILIEITHFMNEFSIFKDVNIDGLFEYHIHLYGLLYNISNTKFISNYQKAFRINFLKEDLTLIRKMKSIKDHS